MKNHLFDHALNALAHPVSIGAAIVLLLNAMFWQAAFPSWWTGKIGDAAWLVIAPVLFGVLLSLVVPTRWVNEHRLGASTIVMTGLGYVLVKAIPAVNALVLTAFRSISFHPKLALDPTDLLVLPMLLVSWWVWQHPQVKLPTGVRRWSSLGLVVLALLADSPAPLYEGMVCLTDQADQTGNIYAFAQWQTHEYFGSGKSWAVYFSTDGGVTWEQAQSGSSHEKKLPKECSQISWPVTLRNYAGQAWSLYYLPGQGVYSSNDGGRTLKLEQKIETITSGLWVRDKDTVVLAAGTAGLYVRTQDGAWTNVMEKK